MTEVNPLANSISTTEELEKLLILGNELASQGLHEQALIHFLKLVELDSESAAGWEACGHALDRLGRWGEAAQALTHAADLDPTNIDHRSALGILYHKMSNTDGQIHWYGEALALQPNSLILKLNHALVLPAVATSREQVDALIERCETLFSNLESAENLEFSDARMRCQPSLLAYYNRNNRPLLESYGRMMFRCYGDDPSFDQRVTPKPKANGDKIRIGFISGFFCDHSNARAFEGLIKHINHNLFEVVLIHLADSRHDAVSEELESYCDEVQRLSAPTEEAVTELRRLVLDVLFFTDIGMHPDITRLASRRHAPLQVTGWGWPQTSGLPTVDAYLSGDLVESEFAQEHYSENLIRLPGIPCCYLSERLEDPTKDRGYFFLPEDRLFGCIQSLHKIHPDFDDILESIAKNVPEAWFVFVESQVTSFTEIFLNRIAKYAPHVSNRMILLGHMSRQDFQSLAACLDMLLDTPYFGSGVTLFETIHDGTPIITLEGPFLRSRFVAGAYRLMGVGHPPVAQSAEEYVKIASRLMQDSEARMKLREEIRHKAKTHLYDRLDYVRGFEDFALDAIRRGGVSRDGQWQPQST
ncbi:MAG: hypothetical protein WCK64_09465 [Synechococcaceae cyanobacterium ELA445]